MRRLRLRNATHLVEFPDNGPGMLQAVAFRRLHPQFKRRRIRHILQMCPEQVSLGDIHPIAGY
jgi:hypothetical protein